VKVGYHSEDSTLCGLLLTGTNFHSYITKLVFGLDCDINDVKKLYPKERAFAKEFDLSKFYGSQAKRIQASSMKHGFGFNLEKCREINDIFHEEFAEYFEWKKIFDNFLKQGNTAVNLVGRPFKLTRQTVSMKGVNTIIQSGASDLVLMSATKIQDRLREVGGQVLLLVHDEIVTEVPEAYANQAVEIINECMTDYNLTNKWGQIKLTTEGAVSDYWEK
jgi:DNA polymerase-1